MLCTIVINRAMVTALQPTDGQRIGYAAGVRVITVRRVNRASSTRFQYFEELVSDVAFRPMHAKQVPCLVSLLLGFS